MARAVWDADGTRKFSMGTSKGMLFPKTEDGTGYDNGAPWSGLTAVNEDPSGAEATDLFADNIKYARLLSAEDYDFTIEAYYYPPEFGPCDGSAEVLAGVRIGQQTRRPFGFSWETIVGNDQNPKAGRVIHIVWNATAQPSQKNHETMNDNPDAETFSWDCGTLPVPVTGYEPTAVMEVDTTGLSAAKLKALEDKLYGTDTTEPTLPTPPDEVIALLKA